MERSKRVFADQRNIYAATNTGFAEKTLFAVELKWGIKYKYAIPSWQSN